MSGNDDSNAQRGSYEWKKDGLIGYTRCHQGDGNVTEYTLDWGAIDIQGGDNQTDITFFGSMIRDPHDNREYLRVALPSSVYHKFKNLLSLSIHHCPHPGLSIEDLPMLTSLDLLNCDFIRLSSSIGHLSNLTWLSIRNNNNIESLPDTIKNLKSLENIDLTNNQQLMIPTSVLSLGSLKSITIKKCKGFDEDVSPGTSRLSESLERIDLSGCRLLSDLPSNIGNFKKLKTLYVYDCPISNLPPSIGGCTDLEYISIPKLGILSLPREIGNLKKLCILECVCPSEILRHKVNLSNLKILSIEGTIDSTNTLPFLPQLERLYVEIERSADNGDESGSEELTVFNDDNVWKGGALKRLGIDFKDVGEEHGSIFKGGLPSTLRCLDLHGCKVKQLTEVLKNETSLPMGLRKLQIRQNNILTSISDEERCHCIRYLLETYERLYSVLLGNRYRGTDDPLPFFETYLSKFNKCGRALLRSGSDMGGDGEDSSNGMKPFPLSFWATVLARVHKVVNRPDYIHERKTGHETKRKELEASILYQFLHGPAFLSRNWTLCDTVVEPSTTRKRKSTRNNDDFVPFFFDCY